jgi:hypothetical protein
MDRRPWTSVGHLPQVLMLLERAICLRRAKNANTPPEWAGTLLRAFFAVRKQHKKQVKPVEGGSWHNS